LDALRPKEAGGTGYDDEAEALIEIVRAAREEGSRFEESVGKARLHISCANSALVGGHLQQVMGRSPAVDPAEKVLAEVSLVRSELIVGQLGQRVPQQIERSRPATSLKNSVLASDGRRHEPSLSLLADFHNPALIPTIPFIFALKQTLNHRLNLLPEAGIIKNFNPRTFGNNCTIAFCDSNLGAPLWISLLEFVNPSQGI
jgi:hypothetical protein